MVNAQIPVSFYNINYTNAQLNYYTTNPSVISTINIPYGNYSITTLIQQLTLSFAASSITMTIAYSKTSGRLTFTSSINFSINTFDDTYTPGSSLYQIMGFRENTIYKSVSLVLISEFPANIISMQKIRVCSSLLSTNCTDSLTYNSSNILIGIPITAGAFGVIEYDNIHGRRSILTTRSIDLIDLQLMDQENRLLDMNNSSWSICLAITSTRRVNTSSGSFTDATDPLFQEREIVGGGGRESLDKQRKTDSETDLDYFMYEQGIEQ